MCSKMGVVMKCSIPGCLVAHDINVIDEHNIWDVYESFPEEDKIRILILWKRLYQRAIDGSWENTNLDFANSVVKKCEELLEKMQCQL
jgi:hypothetical protein